MALRTILLRKKLNDKKHMLEKTRAKDADFEKREKEAEKAIEEMDETTTEDDRKTIEDEVEAITKEKEDHEADKKQLEADIERLEKELVDLENEGKKIEDPKEQERETNKMGKANRRTKFFGMNNQERDAFIKDENVQGFLQRVRELGLKERSIKGVDLTVPDVVLDLIRENITKFSKLVSRVRLRSVSGKTRQTVMGTVPEAVWTEMCAKLNSIDFGFSQTEVDGYKVGGIIYICKATLQDSDYNLAEEIISMIGQSIGIALDKAILYGTGLKMPEGIVTRLAQQTAPVNYPNDARTWEDLHTSNLITIPENKTGLEFFKEIIRASGSSKSKYSQVERFWVMNDTTAMKIQIEAMNFNSAGAVVAVQNGKMPVSGGDFVIVSDDVVPDNNIVSGYGDLYLLAEREGAEFARSDEYLFADDMVAFKGTARYDGKSAIAEGFTAIGLGNAPVTSASFIGDTANDASLQSLSINGKALTPAFVQNKYEYDLTVTETTLKINATPTQSSAKVNVKYNGKNVNNTSDVDVVTAASGKIMEFKVKNGLSELVYRVNIKKS